MSEDHKPLPVQGYTAQSTDKVALVNENKELEERVLRQLDRMGDLNGTHVLGQANLLIDPRMLALARTKIQEAFMWANRAVFRPTRISLPEDLQ